MERKEGIVILILVIVLLLFVFIATREGGVESIGSAPRKWDTCYDGFYYSRTRINGFCGSTSFLSNFYEYPIEFKGNAFKNSEAVYQAQKFVDKPEIYALFFEASADVAKRLATVHDYDKSEFVKKRVPIMKEIVSVKFSDPDLRARLLATGNRELVEYNWWGDTFWGKTKSGGENNLGKILVEEREKIRSEIAT